MLLSLTCWDGDDKNLHDAANVAADIVACALRQCAVVCPLPFARAHVRAPCDDVAPNRGPIVDTPTVRVGSVDVPKHLTSKLIAVH